MKINWTNFGLDQRGFDPTGRLVGSVKRSVLSGLFEATAHTPQYDFLGAYQSAEQAKTAIEKAITGATS